MDFNFKIVEIFAIYYNYKLYSSVDNVIDLTKVERENKVYVNDMVIILDKESIKPPELLELAGYSSLVYDCYLVRNNEGNAKKKTKKKTPYENKLLKESSTIHIETGMKFNAVLKQ